ncbi:glycosyltransferase family 4 protein [Halomonas sp. HAL1]|uniref:glycosyltransferase family 4 protein n=1 Tax=Halomonas sp. HAL1 TaxID=550984 RepID=UPI00022D2A1A|nr:glycosyltransferase [Halomonas sp. HAL1]EHA14328.1 group 1 glycosyl transferase [Halomonas sp. HAL1]WKV92413.1 glycosyltransferase [Halomonas sp. HAL1]
MNSLDFNSPDVKSEVISLLVFSGYYLPGYKGGGPIKTIKNLFDQAGDEITFKLITSDRDLGDMSPYASVTCGAWNQVGNASVFYVQPGKIGYAQIARELRAKDYDIVYLNSFFSPRFSLFPLLVAKVLRQKVVLGPRGELSEGALSLKALKKRVFITAFKLLGLHHRTIFQASSDYEAEDIRRVLGTGVDIRVAGDVGAQEFAECLEPRASRSLKAVFVSRISPMKNLLAALEMLQKVQRSLNYDIYGPIEDRDYWHQCESVIEGLPSHIQVEHKGELKPDAVVKTMANYDAFFMPTKGENYSHVITEAFCAGLPVLIANTTPWRNLHQQGIGWDLPLNNPDAFSAVLDELATMPADEYLEARKRVLAWAKNKFTQRDAIEANIALFKYAYEKK